ncbi:unnamed protein product [Mesocestoides corti]|uniref:EamA domain-containing protein n=1 Tax=Mesocestoides corti TaxID=53468 RepID=A0A0R3U5Y5_MESCO|nr:unnamed protein product [Mesocestoides corti]
MWLTFVMALKKSSNVVTVVILNSAFFGYLFFGESISPTWSIGFLFLILGCCLLSAPKSATVNS